MKRFLAFSGESYYAAGGWDDFCGAFDLLDDAEKAATSASYGTGTWWHVVDTETLEIVKGGGFSYAGQDRNAK